MYRIAIARNGRPSVKQTARLRTACCCILAMGLSAVILATALAAAAHAAPGDFVILGQGNAFWTNNLDAKISKKLIKLQPDHTFETVGFTTHGDWVVVFGSGGHSNSNGDLPVCQKISELRQNKKNKIKCAAFSPSGAATLLWNQSDAWSSDGIPPAMIKKLQQVADEDGTLRSVAFGPDGAWVVLYGKSGIWYDQVPQDLGKVFENALKKELTVHCVAFTSTGTWFCLTSGGWWTSDASHPAAKMIADLVKKGNKLHWIAVQPEGGPHDFQKFDEIVQQIFDDKRPGGYAYAVMHKGKVVASRAHGWARAPWEKHDPSVKWTLDKPMGLASVSKTITAVGLLKLWEETGKKFSLDDPFWPHIKAICPQASAGAKTVTIRQLLQHKSGFKKGLGDLETPAALEKLLTLPLEHMAGTHGQYDNNNFYIARLVLEQIGHVQYTPYVKQHVLAPMGITHMETHFQAHQPTCGYGKLGSTRPGYPFDWDMTAKAGGAGWYASINEMCRFLRGLRDHTVLSPATTDMMYKDLLGWDISKPGWEKNGGWSWDEGNKPGSRAGALGSSLYHFPDDVDAIMLINSEGEPSPETILRRAWQGSM
jgi:CubicO group peptidase (beta-lactamase class C family)